MKGFKTVAFGLGLAIAPNALTFLAGVDWTQYVSANNAALISGLIVVALRFVTTSGVFKK